MFTSCVENAFASAQKNYGEDSNYYIALRKLDEGKINEAIVHLLRASEKASAFIARKSLEKLVTLGNENEKESAIKKLLERYNDEESLLLCARELQTQEAFTKILVLTEKINLANCNAELAVIRLRALYKTESAHFENAILKTYSERSLSRELFSFAKETNARVFQSDIISFRLDIYEGNWKLASLKAKSFLENQNDIKITASLASDIGKACLYGSANNSANAKLFEKLAKNNCDDKKLLYIAHFYAGRLYARNSENFLTAKENFLSAMEIAETQAEKDNALWYLFDASLRVSETNTIEMLDLYAKEINNASYFDDFFETLSSRLLSDAKFNLYKTVYETIDGFASDEACGKFAYLYARFLERGLAESETKNADIEKAFLRATKSGTNVYYKLLAATRLKLSDDAILKLLLQTKAKQNFVRNVEAEKYLLGFAQFGLPEKIYDAFLEIDKKQYAIGISCAIQLSQFLNKTGNIEHNFYPESLRIISRVANSGNEDVTKSALKLLYPKNYERFIEEYAKKFSLESEVMFALVRSESFFDSDIVSSAGAVGLTQLMELTAGDIASKLKQTEYSLTDARTNIEFGSYYLASLLKRLNGDALLSFFSYNAGITRVRRWLKNADVELGGKKNAAYDLFLETIPYAETREYGRKLVSATSVYGFLYFSKSPSKVASELVMWN